MTTTPPPPSRRAHTPPPPFHGPRYDSWEPYSPRRSSRVAAQRSPAPQQSSSSGLLSPKSRRQRAVTPTSSRNTTNTSNPAFSPPSSPVEPFKHQSPRSTRRQQVEPATVDSDSDHLPRSAARQLLSTMDPRAMLPTPAKTPRKKAVKQDALKSTARVLFPTRPATVDEAMPTPRKSRKSTKLAFSLDSFENMEEEHEKIEIYTDSKERVPEVDDDEDNPFVTRGKAKKPTPKSRKRDAKAMKMEERAANDEGMIYVFRGRKIFRKFHDRHPSGASVGEQELNDSSEEEVRRRAGAESDRRFTRSSIRPRLLFPNEDQRREREMGPDDIDEEAVTDIEAPLTVSKKGRKAEEIVTPVKQNFTPASPPSTIRSKRGKRGEKHESMEIDEEAETSHATAGEEEIETPPAARTRSAAKKASPFDSWQRVKSSSNSSRSGTKRGAESLERSEGGKRTRSGAQPAAGPSS